MGSLPGLSKATSRPSRHLCGIWPWWRQRLKSSARGEARQGERALQVSLLRPSGPGARRVGRCERREETSLGVKRGMSVQGTQGSNALDEVKDDCP
eukprot:5415563-Prorocentrum_lima.AAC.1